MPGTHDLWLFILSGLLLNITPGPDTLYIVARSTTQGFRGGAMAAMGIGTGTLVHILGAALGLSAVLAASATAFTVIKIAGAAYLLYVGLSLLAARKAPLGKAQAVKPAALRTVFVQGFLTNVLNPKVALFFLALLPQFVDPAAGPVAPQMLLLGLIVTLTAIPCDLAVAFASGKAARLVAGSGWLIRAQHALSGTILVGLGVFVALARRPTP
jgi:threonine/homoserine/homoserine lactone efflux protein